MDTTRHRREEVEGTAKGVGQGENAQYARTAVVELIDDSKGDIRGDVVHGEHHTLRESRGTTRIAQEAHLVVAHLGILDVVGRETSGVAVAIVLNDVFLEGGNLLAIALEDAAEVGEREYGLDAHHLLLVNHIPEGVAQEEEFRLGVVDDVVDVVGVEVLKDGDNHSTIGDGGQIGDDPAGVVAANEGDFVTLLDITLPKEHVELGNLLGHLIVGETLLLEVVCQSRHLAVLLETALVNLNQVFLYHKNPIYGLFCVFVSFALQRYG